MGILKKILYVITCPIWAPILFLYIIVSCIVSMSRNDVPDFMIDTNDISLY